jgi:hypothetical protein
MALVVVLAVSTLWLGSPALARNHSELEWQTLTTEHFLVHYHQGAEQTARRTAAIAEEVYPAITGLYDFEPELPVHFIIRDTDDYANGATYYYDDKIEIWATALEFHLRGTHNWLRDVITHEFTHMVQLQASARMPHRLPAVYLQAFGYEPERREDVLIGYPRAIISYPISGTITSAWFAEGVAQYQTARIYNDWWDTHRDMILRMATLDGTILTYDQMTDLDKNGLEAEMVYNHGNGFVRWIAERYGEEKLGEIARGLSKFWAVSEQGAFKDATGKSASELYADWKADLEREYGEVRATIEPDAVLGTATSEGGYLNLYPRYRAGTGELYWVTNQGSDYGSVRLVRRDLEQAGSPDGEIRSLTRGMGTPPAFTPDGNRIYYSKRLERNRYGSRVYDVYVLDLETRREKRLTHDLRAKDPSPSPDGEYIAAVLNGDGTGELVLLDAEGVIARHLTVESPHGTQYYQPVWSEDGGQLLYTTYQGVSRDIALIDLDTGESQMLASTPADERDPIFVPGENAIIFSSDRTGIFNLFHLDLDTGAIRQLTNVYGGAFFPDISADGELAYSAFTGAGYEIRRLPHAEWYDREVDPGEPIEPRGDYRLASAGPTALKLTENRFYDGPASDYKDSFPVTQFMPRLIIDDGRPRLGAYIGAREILERHSVFGGGAVGRRYGGFEFEGFVLYENRMLPVTIFADAFRVRRRSEDLADAKITGGIHEGEVRPVNFELRYDVTEIDAGVRYEWGPPFSYRYRKDLSVYYIRQKNHINLFATDDLDGSFYGKDGWDYYVGNSVHVRYDYRSVGRAIDSEINPRGGRQFTLRWAHNWANLNPAGNVDTENFQPIFEKNEFNEYEIDWREFFPLPWGRHTLELRGRGGLIDDTEVDDFFWWPIGSKPGLRGYSYFSKQGRKMAIAAATYRFPILRRIDQRFLSLFMHRLYGGVFFEAGNAWNDESLEGLSANRLLRDAGFELRLESTSFYVFPASFYIEGAYGFDEIYDDDGRQLGGNEWRWYTGLLFGY